MPPQDQAPVKDANIEQMPMNLKEGDRYVVNYSEGLTAVDFDDHVSLVEKESASMAGMVGRGDLARDKHNRKDAAAGFATDERETDCCRRVGPRGLRRISKGRSGWLEIRSDDSKHRLLCFRSQCLTEFDAEMRRDLALGKRLHRSRVAASRGSHNRWKSLSVDAEEATVGRGRSLRRNNGEGEEDRPP
ncbi:hypothetical protein B296_00024729 [Ensete ventricosum]|uniref:Uncharacterized protein n=1 Tax=Ensete ventricosum TaxID=4639 RepID=A0A427AB99_ENSVE|nr:hypothetical protein B296_00024729 [Ensete ventricosum]